MNRYKILTITFLLAIGIFALAGLQFCLAGQSSGSKPASVLMQEALYAEEIDGDLDAAIKIYGQVTKNSSAQRSHVAQALYRQGMCYLKQQNEQQAQENFQTLIAQYSEQTEIINKVKPLLDDLGNADPAALMPPGTLFYAEIGSPGRQIETILKMLKDTPLENPFAALGGNNTGWEGSGPPANIIAGLLNPGMMAEFKKIQGMGVGITGIPIEDEPPAIVVLFPGKSDALKGLLQMALTMAGKPTESIEGMQTVLLPEGGCAAYDENVVILSTQKAYEAGNLAWSVKQYKGMSNEPTLVSSNKSFAKVSRKTRQDNLLTVWIDIDNLFAGVRKILPEEELPEQVLMANGFVNFDSVDDILASFSFEENGIAVETNVAFKDGHTSLAYNMLRTPNLSKTAFEAVPSSAVGLVSFVLGDADSAQAMALGQKIQSQTGLDIVKDIYANIDQVTLFILPPDGSSGQVNPMVPPPVTSLGLALTSDNPERTRQLFSKILSADILPDEVDAGLTEPVNGRYEIELGEGPKLHCYMDQDRKTTIISLAPNVIESSLSAMKTRQSALTGGPLQEPLSKLSPGINKLVMINVAGIIRMAQSNMGSFAEQNNLNEIFDKLATSSEKTFIRLRTRENPDNLNIRADIIGVPPLNELFVPIMQLAQIMESTGGEHWDEKRIYKTVTVTKADRSPAIDGKEERIWSAAAMNKLGNEIYSPISSDEDFSAYYKTMWDEKNLYVLVDVTDDKLENDNDRWYLNDCIEILIDADNSKLEQYDENDFQFHFDWDKNNPTMAEDEYGKTEGVEFAMVTTGNGYRTEIKFPWSTLGTKPAPGVKVGFEVLVNDNDDDERSKLAWNNVDDHVSGNPGKWGIADMAGLVGRWNFDETEDNIVSDLSGNKIAGILKEDAILKNGAGRAGSAVTFPSPGSCVEISAERMSASAGTVALWAKLFDEQDSPDHRYLFGHTTVPHYGNRIQLYMNEGTTKLDVGLGDTHETNTDMTTLEVNKWYHIVLSWDNGTNKVYLNGENIASGSYDGLDELGATVNIGNNGRIDNRDQSFKGLIDDVMIYNYALSDDEIKAIGK
jgi:tetratricopeptide (TPR) repeat protein